MPEIKSYKINIILYLRIHTYMDFSYVTFSYIYQISNIISAARITHEAAKTQVYNFELITIIFENLLISILYARP